MDFISGSYLVHTHKKDAHNITLLLAEMPTKKTFKRLGYILRIYLREKKSKVFNFTLKIRERNRGGEAYKSVKVCSCNRAKMVKKKCTGIAKPNIQDMS